jgi:hypothetical protein
MPTPKPPADQPEVKSGVTLPSTVSELRRKLGQKAKQERQRVYRLPAGESVHAHLQRLWLQPFWTTHR